MKKGVVACGRLTKKKIINQNCGVYEFSNLIDLIDTSIEPRMESIMHKNLCVKEFLREILRRRNLQFLNLARSNK